MLLRVWLLCRPGKYGMRLVNNRNGVVGTVLSAVLGGGGASSSDPTRSWRKYTGAHPSRGGPPPPHNCLETMLYGKAETA
jgi:hypothetical protein